MNCYFKILRARVTAPLLAVAIGSLGALPVARADSVCIAKPASSMSAPATLAGDGPRAVGTLAHRRCYPVVERMERDTRILVTSEDGFKGEVEVSNSMLAHVLTDDIDMVLSPDGEVFGKVMSGSLVRVESHPSPDTLRATLLEGRLRARFLVAQDDVYPTQSWPRPDPDERADGEWPSASQPPPPAAGILLDDPTGMQLRAQLRGSLAYLEDLRNDPASGASRMEVLETRSDARKVLWVGPTVWAEGWVTGGSWLEDAPAGGWSAVSGFPETSLGRTGARQVGAKPASLHLAVKGAEFGALEPGARVDVLAEEKSWLQVRSDWNGGEVTGWLEKKRLLKKGKELPRTARVAEVAAVRIGRIAQQWRSPEDHREELPAQPAGNAAAASGNTGGGADQAPVEPKTHIVPPELNLDPVLSQLSRSMARLQWLYAQALEVKPQAGGEVTVRVLVGPSGKVIEQGIQSASFKAAEFHELIEGELSSLPFEKRKVPRRKRGQPERDWHVQVWIQYSLSTILQ